MHVHSDVEIDIDKISVCLILPMGGNCSKVFVFRRAKFYRILQLLIFIDWIPSLPN